MSNSFFDHPIPNSPFAAPHGRDEGYGREGARQKKAAMDTSWVPDVNHLRPPDVRWASADRTSIQEMEANFKAKMKSNFDVMIAGQVRA